MYPLSLRMLVWVALMTAMSAAIASPTDNEYQACHRQAARVVEMCLDETPGGDGTHCWKRAQAHQRACYREVRAAHVPDRRRIEAMRQAELEVRQRAEAARQRAEEVRR